MQETCYNSKIRFKNIWRTDLYKPSNSLLQLTNLHKTIYFYISISISIQGHPLKCLDISMKYFQFHRVQILQMVPKIWCYVLNRKSSIYSFK